MSVNPVVYAADFGAVADGTDQTAEVQLACDVITARGSLVGGRLIIDRGIKFRRDALAMPQNVIISHYQSDNLSITGWSQYQATPTEFVGIANGGAVNENVVACSDYHPAAVVRLDNRASNRDQYLGVGQRRKPAYNNPSRMSFWMYDNEWDAFSTLYNCFAARTPYNQVAVNAWSKTAKLYGLTGAVVDKSLRTSGGAIGVVKAVAAGYVIVDIVWGVFNVGETAALYDFIGETNETLISNCGGTITNVVASVLPCNPINYALSSGAVGFGVGADMLKSPWGFGGSIIRQLPVNLGQNCPPSHATFVQDHFVNDASHGGGAGMTRAVDTAHPGKAMWFMYGSEMTPGVYLGSDIGPAARCLLRPGGGLFGADNIASAAWSGGGFFAITFTRPLSSADYAITFGPQWGRDYATYDSKTVNGFSVYIYDLNDAAPRAAKTPHGEISVVVHGP